MIGSVRKVMFRCLRQNKGQVKLQSSLYHLHSVREISYTGVLNY